jgi:protease II
MKKIKGNSKTIKKFILLSRMEAGHFGSSEIQNYLLANSLTLIFIVTLSFLKKVSLIFPLFS